MIVYCLHGPYRRQAGSHGYPAALKGRAVVQRTNIARLTHTL